MYGPGTVFYRARMREEAKRKKKSKQGFRGAKFGLSAPVTQLVPDTSAPGHNVTRKSAVDIDSDEDFDYERKSIHVMDKSIHPYGAPFLDYRSSDQALTVLEERIKNWHSTFTSAKQRKYAKQGTVKLERVKIEVGSSKHCVKYTNYNG